MRESKIWDRVHAFACALLAAALFCGACGGQGSSPAAPGATSAANTPAGPLPSTITAPDAFALVQGNRDNPGFVILDVRTATEFAGAHLAGAVNIDYYSPGFRSMILALDSGRRYLVYCRTGVRGAASTQLMAGLGFLRVQNLTGGLEQWVQDGYPTVG